jgi:hypothetical protein
MKKKQDIVNKITDSDQFFKFTSPDYSKIVGIHIYF